MSTQKWIQENQEKLKECKKQHYLRNKSTYIEKAKKQKQEMKIWYEELKSKLSCNRCGENHVACLQFHHLDPKDKEVSVSTVVSLGWSKKRIMAEIEKCEVLCANCHAKLHYAQRQQIKQA